MASHGKTVRIYLADGSPTGIRHAEVVNWSGQAMVCPRTRISELSEWPESQRPGVYILMGEAPDTATPLAYIGEAEVVLQRLRSHYTGKDFWDRVVFFTSKDDNLTKSHVKYLEARFVSLGHEARRCRLENGNNPAMPTLPPADRDAMEEFIGPARILLGALGFNLLEPVKRPPNRDNQPATRGTLATTTLYLEMPKHNVNANGMLTDEGFVVSAGSIGCLREDGYLSPPRQKIRQQLIDDGTVMVEGTALRFVRDVLLNSPSAAAAAAIVIDGRKKWPTGVEGRRREFAQ